MGYSFKYIPILFLISYIIYLLTLPNNKKDGFKNYLEIEHTFVIEYEGWIPDINPHLDPAKETKKGIDLIKRHLN